MTQELRIVERKEDSLWVRVRMIEIKKGDVFRMFEDGTPIEWSGKTEFEAAYDADETGVITKGNT
jgi:hypothetical protein